MQKRSKSLPQLNLDKGSQASMDGKGVRALDLDLLHAAGATRVVITLLHYTNPLWKSSFGIRVLNLLPTMKRTAWTGFS